MKSLLLTTLVGLMLVGSLQPVSASGGWLWFDKYPWVYSYKEQGWIYLSIQGGTMYAYRASNNTWVEFGASISEGWLWFDQLPWVYSEKSMVGFTWQGTEEKYSLIVQSTKLGGSLA